jgi:hypothetical protein
VFESKLRAFVRPGLIGLRRNIVPGLVLQACALLIVLGYFFVPSFHATLDAIGGIKTRYGYFYSAVSTALFGGVIPFVVLFLTRQVPKGRVWAGLAFYAGFWMWKGVEVDALYRCQVLLFGNAVTFGTVAAKTCVDQFAYNPLWAGPTQVIFFLWKDANFSWTGLKWQLEQESLLHRVVVVLFSTWVVWLPAVAIVYTLPIALQIPLSNLVLCFWCLLLSFISKSGTQETETQRAASLP